MEEFNGTETEQTVLENDNNEVQILDNDVQFEPEKPKKDKTKANEARRKNWAKGREKLAEKRKHKKKVQTIDIPDVVESEDDSDSGSEEIIIRKKEKEKPKPEVPQQQPYIQQDSELIKRIQMLEKRLKSKKPKKSTTQVIINPTQPAPIVQEDPQSVFLKQSIFGFR